jgi:hypothetical protein
LRGRVLTRRAELAARYGAFGGTSAELEAAEEAYDAAARSAGNEMAARSAQRVRDGAAA